MLQFHLEIPFIVDPSDPSYLIFSNGKRIHKKQLKTLEKKLAKELRKISIDIYQKNRGGKKDAN